MKAVWNALREVASYTRKILHTHWVVNRSQRIGTRYRAREARRRRPRQR